MAWIRVALSSKASLLPIVWLGYSSSTFLIPSGQGLSSICHRALQPNQNMRVQISSIVLTALTLMVLFEGSAAAPVIKARSPNGFWDGFNRFANKPFKDWF
ncbi:hypothetical protein PGT21_011515 [Puccinia graminis f. sp. tritici]|uniref:Uncharacterized protein n=2 Tax=Puccinia graminis f. sp. tritici TaxID=56615 RepID=A0A5B0PXB7_PUCGR|nr:hypothetical protein PGT21_011515 [Puccinia graminis f. sp. tritici]